MLTDCIQQTELKRSLDRSLKRTTVGPRPEHCRSASESRSTKDHDSRTFTPRERPEKYRA